MRFLSFGILTALATASALAQAPLLCPPATTPSAHACDAFHYHVQLYRPDTRGFIELYGINQFATQAACDRAREAAMKRSLAIVDFYRRQRNDQRYEPDRFGPCHCDMTLERTSSNYLTEPLRVAQVRMAADVRMHVRERLIDADVPTDSDLLRPTVAQSPVGGPKLVPLPPAPAVATVANNPADLKVTTTAENAPPSALDLPLADVVTPPSPAADPAPSSPPARAGGETPPDQPARTPAVQADVEDAVEDAAEAFLPTETERVQKIIAASTSLTDDVARVKVLEACSQRIQLLSNLRSLIEGAGQHSKLADAARDSAHQEARRLAFLAKLFGSDIPAHWAPKDARDAVVPLVADPEKILRDANAPAEQKRHALYAFLATGSPTDEQQLWLNRVVETLLP